MPIRPENRSRYPRDWRQIAAGILARAGRRCEYVSPSGVRCSAEHHAVGRWSDNDTSFEPIGSAERKTVAEQLFAQYGPIRMVWVILTVAHTENEDPADVRPENLMALCQRHHNRLDGKRRAEHARATRERQKETA